MWVPYLTEYSSLSVQVIPSVILFYFSGINDLDSNLKNKSEFENMEVN